MFLGVVVGGSGASQGLVDAGLRGRVVSVWGMGAAGATVRAESVESGVETETVTGRDGGFVLLRLVPGRYRVTLGSATGVVVGQAAAEVELGAGEMGEVVLSAIGSAGVAVGGLGVGGDGAGYGRGMVEGLPAKALEWETAGELDSEVHQAGVGGGESGDDDGAEGSGVRSNDGEVAGGMSSGGVAVTQNAAVLDGLSAEQGYGAGPRGATSGGVHAGASFGEGAVGSFRVMPRTFSAQYGGAAGGVVAVVSRGGGERVRGSGFVLLRESAWAATNPFSVVTRYSQGAGGGVVTSGLVKPQDREQQFGAAVGGTVRGRWVPGWLRAAAFVSDEEQVKEGEIVSSPAVASFYELTPTQVALLGNRGVSAAATGAALGYLDSLTGTLGRTATRNMGFGRADVRASAKDLVTLGWIRNRFEQPAGVALGQASAAVVARGLGSVGDSTVRIDAVTGRWLHRFTPWLNHELRAQWGHDLEFETARGPLAQEPGIGPGGFAPQVSIGPNGFGFGTPANLGRTAAPDEHRVQVANSLQLARGGHVLMVGGDWSRVEDRIASATNAEGSFSYDSGVTGGKDGGLVDWITDYTFSAQAYPNGACPSITAAVHLFCFRSFTQSFGAQQTEFVVHDVAGFVEDVYRPRSNLVVTLGMRYEYTLLPVPQSPNYVLDGLFGSGLGGATERFPEDRNNVGPRLAVAWSPRGSLMTVRLGYGVFYGRLAGGVVRAALADTAQATTALRVRITPKTVTGCPQVANQGFGYGCDYVTVPPAAVAQTSSAVVFGSGYRLPAVQRMTLEVERGLGKHGMLKVGYAGAVATQLPQTVDRNIAASTAVAVYVVQGGDGHRGIATGQTLALPLYTERLASQYGPVMELVSNANATYHSGTVEARVRAEGWEVRGSYTFSKALDYNPMDGATVTRSGQLDPFSNGYDKGISNQNIPQRFVGDLIYGVRLGVGPEGLRRVVSGVKVAAIGQVGSGTPYGYGVFGGTYLAGGSESLNGSGGATYLPTVGRNTLRLPWRSNLDLKVGKDVRVQGRVRAEAFVQGFNVLNSVSVSRVETRAFLLGAPATTGGPTPLVFQDAATIAAEGLNTPAFGTALSSTSGLRRERQVEMGLRVEF